VGTRVGEVGDWTNYFSSEMEEEIFRNWIEPLQRRGLTFVDRPQWTPSRRSIV